MNDFTKEELSLINYCFENISFRKFMDNKDIQPLYLKINNMIDNYCEHEWENICCQCTLDKIYCHKCEKDMGDLKERYPNAE